MKKFSILTGAVLLLFSSCGKFEEINVNPNNPAIVPAEMLLPPIISGAANAMNRSSTRAGQYVQHLAWLGGTSEEDDRYNLTGASFREEWNGPMRLIKDINQLKEIGAKGNQQEYVAVGSILKVYILSLMSDAYGDIPYNEAGMGNVSGLEFAHYQSQQEVYVLMLKDLESANQQLKNLTAGTVVKRDILFNGSINRWRKFANSLKVRILMRQSAKVDVKAAIAAIFNNPTEYPVFEGNNDQATLTYNNGTDLYYWFIQNPPADGSGVDFSGNTRVSNVLVDLLKSKNDPRLTIFAAPTKNSYTANAADESNPLVYRGQRAGLSNAEQNADYVNTGLNKDDYSVIGKRIRKESRSFLMTYTELMLLKAEAIHRNMGVNGSAGDVYMDAVKASLEKWPAIGSATQSETPFISEEQKKAYLGQSSVGLSTTNPLKQIAEQLWIDAYLNGFEGWAGWRRLGFPELIPGPTVLSQIPVRYVYSDNEQNNPNLLLWVKENMAGKMPTHDTKVWFQP